MLILGFIIFVAVGSYLVGYQFGWMRGYQACLLKGERFHPADDWASWIADLRAASAVLKELEANDGK
jgi:hypothetical protein